MICNKCHVHVEEGTTVCPVCGAEINAEQTIHQETPTVIVEDVTITPCEHTAEVDNPFEITEDVLEETPAVENEETEVVPAKKKTWVKVTAIVACLALFLGLAATIW